MGKAISGIRTQDLCFTNPGRQERSTTAAERITNENSDNRRPSTATDNDTELRKVEADSEVARPALLPGELAEVVVAWPTLPEHIKAAILALVGTAAKGKA